MGNKRTKVYFETWGYEQVKDQVLAFEKKLNRFAFLCEQAGAEVYDLKVETSEKGIIGTVTFEKWSEEFDLSAAMQKLDEKKLAHERV